MDISNKHHHHQILDVQNALRVLEKNCTSSDKSYICKRLEMASVEIIHAAHNQMPLATLHQYLKDIFQQKCLSKIKVRIKLNQIIVDCCEIYFHHLVFAQVFPWICAKNQTLDAQLNQNIVTHNFGNNAVEHKWTNLHGGSKANLTLLSFLTNPKAKLDALDKLLTLPTLLDATSINSSPISSDELLPWLIQSLANCGIFNLYSQLDYMSNFHLSLKPDFLQDQQTLFNLATFEAALEHLRKSKDIQYSLEDLVKTSNPELQLLFQAIHANDIKGLKIIYLSPFGLILDQFWGQLRSF